MYLATALGGAYQGAVSYSPSSTQCVNDGGRFGAALNGAETAANSPYAQAMLGGYAISTIYEALVPAKNTDASVKQAQEAYPNKAGTIEEHHVTPQYLGGPASGETVPLDAAYHQQITNEFRSQYGYGQSVPSESQVEAIKNQVYTKYPLPQ